MVKVQTEQPGGEAQKVEVDLDIQEFDKWFQAQGNEPLVRSEKAILSTYVYWKTHVDKAT